MKRFDNHLRYLLAFGCPMLSVECHAQLATESELLKVYGIGASLISLAIGLWLVFFKKGK